MTLGILLELINAEKQGHQIIRRRMGGWSGLEYHDEVRLECCELSDFVIPEDDDGHLVVFYIKDVEDEWGNKLEQTEES